jgi:hypothetical protein
MRQYFRQMSRLGLLLGGWVFVVGTGWGEEKMDQAKALAELTALVAKNEKMTREVLSKAARDLAEAGQERIKAVQVYLESYRNVEYGRTQDGDTRFGEWRLQEREMISSLAFGESVQLQVRYVALVCREALGEKDRPTAAEWVAYYHDLTKPENSTEVEGAVVTAAVAPTTGAQSKGKKKSDSSKKQSTGMFDQPAKQSPLVRDRQIAGFLEEVPAADVAAGNEATVFKKVLRPRLLEDKNKELLRLWDQRIARMDEGVEKKVKTLGADDYKILKRPELLWERASDQEALGENEAAWAQKMEILRTCPYHPKLEEWVKELRGSLERGSSGLPEKTP